MLSVKHAGPFFSLAVAIAGVGASTPAVAAAGDPARGKAMFVRCVACHDVRPGVKKIGPSLAGVVGRKAAMVRGFAYSPAMKKVNIVWTPQMLDRYLASPATTVKGTRMIFPGIANRTDRANLIAYLATAK